MAGIMVRYEDRKDLSVTNKIRKNLTGEMDMERLTILTIILLALAPNCLSAEPISISRESGMAVLTSLSDNQAGTAANNTSQNMTEVININTTSTSGQPSSEPQITPDLNALPEVSSGPRAKTQKAAGDLWSWGKVPIGFEVNETGQLVRLNNDEWKPSI
ncbi:Uncharacterised protein [uncultured archaeon]|nr:Uncharacterised protein [uncultured archaeon]